MWLTSSICIFLSFVFPSGLALVFVEQPQDIVLVPGGNGTLRCDLDVPTGASASEDPVSVVWKRDGELLQSKRGVDYEQLPDGSMRLTNVQTYNNFRTSPTQWQCMATNSEGTLLSRTAVVGIAYLDPYPTSASRNTRVLGVLNNVIVLSCPARDKLSEISRPPAQIRWLKNGQPVGMRARHMPSGDVQLDNYTPDDNGKYQCELVNGLLQEYANEPAAYISPPVELMTDTVTPIPLTFEKIPPTRSQPALEAVEGETVVFEAAAIADVKPVLEWTRPGGVIPADRSEIIGGGNLRISNVMNEDAGIYRVTARSGNKDITSFTHLVVHGKPVAAIDPATQTVEEGSSVTITCDTGGVSFFRRQWYYNGIELSVDNSSLVFPITSFTHSGLYQCFVENGAGDTSASARLNVVSEPRIIQNPEATVIVDRHERLTIECTVVGQPLPKVTWFYGEESQLVVVEEDASAGRTITAKKTEHGGQEAIRSILAVSSSTYSDSGQYHCHAENSLGNAESEPAIVSIYGAPSFTAVPSPQVVVFGETSVVQFEAAGLPQPDVEWVYPDRARLEGRAHKLDGGHLKLTNVQMADAGLYKVSLTNKYGMDVTEIELEVHVKPSIREKTWQQDAVLGQNYWLTCEILGSPLPTVTWYFEDKEITDYCCDDSKYQLETKSFQHSGDAEKVVRSTLTIQTLTYDDLSKYTCLAVNNGGNASQSVTLEKDGPVVMDPVKGSENIQSDKDFPIWAIIIIILAVILTVMTVLVVAVLFSKKYKAERKAKHVTADSLASHGTQGLALRSYHASASARVVQDEEEAAGFHKLPAHPPASGMARSEFERHVCANKQLSCSPGARRHGVPVMPVVPAAQAEVHTGVWQPDPRKHEGVDFTTV